MNCPSCEEKAGVIHTTALEAVVYRVRKCKECGTSFQTSETIIGDPSRYWDRRNEMRRKKSGGTDA